MARQLTIIVSCDGCGAPDLDPSRGLVLAVGKDAPRQIDLCPDCQVSIWGPLAKLYADAATLPESEPEPVARDKQPVDCPECGYHCPSRSALRSHLETRHDTDTGDWQYRHGHAVDDPEAPVPYVCEACKKAFVNAQGLAQHNRVNHPET